MSKMEMLNLIVAILTPTVGAVYTFFTNRATRREQQEIRQEQIQIQKKQADLEAISQYRQIKQQERYFKEDLVTLTANLKEGDTEAKYISFLSLYSSFTDLYNEVNAFCALLNHNAVSSEGVLKNTGIDLVIKLADEQCKTYETLKNAAEIIGHKKDLKRPDWNAFKEYDIFLKSRLSDNQWERLCNKRKAVGLK